MPAMNRQCENKNMVVNMEKNIELIYVSDEVRVLRCLLTDLCAILKGGMVHWIQYNEVELYAMNNWQIA